MEWKTLTVERDGAVAHVWLSQPERRNALSQIVLEEIAAVFTWLQTQYDVRVVVFGGRGVTFCAGADMKDPPGLARMMTPDGVSAGERRWLAQLGLRAVEAIERLNAVTIARVHGHAIGGGILLMLACDLRIAAEGTVFFFPEVELGSPLDWKGIPRMIREVGFARARQLVLLCERFDAAEAERYGMVNRVVPPDQLDAATREWSDRLVEKPDAVLHMSKAQFRAYAAAVPLGDASEFETELLLEALREDAAREGFGLA